MLAALTVSDELIAELVRADVIVAGVPMYNFGVPAPMKAYIDNIVRIGRTFGFDRALAGQHDWPLLHGKRLVLLISRGDSGYEAGRPAYSMNHVGPICERSSVLSASPRSIRLRSSTTSSQTSAANARWSRPKQNSKRWCEPWPLPQQEP